MAHNTTVMGEEPVSRTPDQPRVADLIKSFQSCSPGAYGWHRLTDNDDTRFARWDNQNKEGTKDKPWEKAADTRVFAADEVIDDLVTQDVVAFWMATLRASGVFLNDEPEAAVWTGLLGWSLERQERDLAREVELASQYRHHYGWCILHPYWRREVRMRHSRVTVEILQALAGRVFGPEAAAALPDQVASGEEDDALVEMFQQLYDLFIAAELRDLEGGETPRLKKRTIRKALGELRREGEARVPAPFLARNEPAITALKPWEDVFVCGSPANLDEATVFVRYFWSESRLREKEVSEGWDREWIEQALNTKGHASFWQTRIDLQDWQWGASVRDESEEIEVIYAYTWRTDADGVPGLYCTVFSPHFSHGAARRELFAKHGLLDYDHEQMPFIYLPAENISRVVGASRSVPEIENTRQIQEKKQRDALVNRTAFETVPSILVPMGGIRLAFGPAVQIPTAFGMEPKFMDTPKASVKAESIIEMLKGDRNEYWGRLSNEVPPARAQGKMIRRVGAFLRAWETAFKQEFQLTQQFISDEEFQRITGAQKPRSGAREIERLYDMKLNFDPRELDFDFAMAKSEAMGKLAAEDSTGAIDQAGLMAFRMTLIDPIAAPAFIVNRAQASRKLFDEVNNTIALASLGNEPQFTEEDPAASMKMRFAQQILEANQKYQRQFQSDSNFREMMMKYFQNLQMSVAQQQNKRIGRIGVQPEGVQVPA